MARLFLTPREINFMNDIAKELVKDVIGQKIYYFPISEVKSRVHDIYEESADKIFENNSKVEVVDTGTGYITAEVDGTERLRVNSSGIDVSGEIEFLKVPTLFS